MYLVLLAAAALTARKIERADGMLGNVRILPKDADCTVLFATCGLSAIATVLSLSVRQCLSPAPCGRWEVWSSFWPYFTPSRSCEPGKLQKYPKAICFACGKREKKI